MSKEPLLVKLQISHFGATVAPRGGYVEGVITEGPHLGKTALVRLDVEAYDSFLARPEVAPHIRVQAGHDPVAVPDALDTKRMQLALRPAFEYPQGGGPASMDEICAKLGTASVVMSEDRAAPLPGMPRDPGRIVGKARGEMQFGDYSPDSDAAITKGPGAGAPKP